MTSTYYGVTAHAHTTCDVATADNRDLSTTIGSAGTATGSASSTSWVEVITMDADVSGDGPSTGNHSASINVTSISSKSQGQFRVCQVDQSGCTVINSTSYSATFTTTGAKTLGPSSMTWNASYNILRISVEIQRTSNSGSRSMSVAIGNSSTYDTAPWTVPITRTFEDSVSASDSLSKATTYVRSFSDSASATDSLSKATTYVRSFSDSVEASDSLKVEVEYNRLLADTVDSFDESGEAEVNYDRTFSDSVEAADAYVAALIPSGGTTEKTFEDSVEVTDAAVRETTIERHHFLAREDIINT